MVPALLVIAVTAHGCAQESTRTPGDQQIAGIPKGQTAAQEERAAFDRATLEGSAVYLVQPGDELVVDAARRKELDRTLRVDSTGNIAMPYAGTVRVVGLTVEQIRDLLKEKLSTHYVDAELTVSVKTSQKQAIYVLGEVKTPGKIAVEGPVRLVEALGRAAGPTYDAELRNVFVFRPNTDPPLAIKTNVKPWFERGAEPDWKANLLVNAGDVVYVPSSLIVDIERFMKRVTSIIVPIVLINREFVVINAP